MVDRLIRFFSSSVRGRLTLLIASVITPAVLLVALFMVQAYRNERETVTRHLIANTRAIAAVVEQHLRKYESLLQGLAASPDLEQDQLAAFDARVRTLLDGTERWIVLMDEEGNQWVNTFFPPQTTHAPVPPGAAWEAARKGQSYVSNLSPGPVSRIQRCYVSIPIKQDGRLKYILCLAMPPTEIAKALDLERIASGNVVTIVDRTGTIVARSRGGKAMIGQKASADMVEATTKYSQGVVNSVTLEGIPVLAAFQRIPEYGWSALIGTPRSELYASARRLLWVGLGLCCLLVINSILITRWIGRTLVHSVDGLVAEVEAIGRGQPAPAHPDGLAETNFVSRAMRITAQRLQEKEADNTSLYAALQNELAQQRRMEEVSRQLAAIVESSNDAIISNNLAGLITSWNKGAERVFGFTAEEMVGQSILRLIPPASQDEEPMILERISRGERIKPYEIERRHKSGRILTVSLTISPIRDRNGNILGASKIARDMTERRRLEWQQQALFELVAKVNKAADLPEIYEAALQAIDRAQNPDHAAILLGDAHGFMRFKASRGWPGDCQRLLEAAPWPAAAPVLEPVCVEDLATSALLKDPLKATLARQGIVSLAFIPMQDGTQLLGQLVIGYDQPHPFLIEELRSAETITSQLAFAIERQNRTAAMEALVDLRTASLQAAIAQLQEFSYSVSHDLRAPVRAMRGYAAIILEEHGHELGPNVRELLTRIQRNGVRMERLIQDLLTYSRLTQREIVLERVSLEKLLSEVVSYYAELLPDKADIEIVRPLPEVMANELLLFQVISNLLTNAVKFVAPGTRPRVRVIAERRGEVVRVWLEDNGIGITPSHQPRLFGLFERIHPDRKYEGTGIGLAIVRKAIERMNGAVGVESDGHSGSRFWFDVPAAP